MTGYFSFNDPQLRADVLSNGKMGVKYEVSWSAENQGGGSKEHITFQVYIEVDNNSDLGTKELAALERAKAIMQELLKLD